MAASTGPSVADLEHSRYFLTEWMPPLLRQTAERSPPRVVADLGAGDGGTLWPLDRAGLVGETIYAVDISPEHVALCERLSPKVRGIVSDVARVDELADGSVDAVVSSQVIEHLPDDRVLAPEIARLLKPGGWFYVSSVIRGPRAFWIYRGKPPAPRRWQLDPTHMREYPSEQAFRTALETLAIVAYLGPCSRPDIARIRGVAADSAVANLVERGLIAESGRDDAGGAIRYRTTPLFERVFGLESLSQLPRLDDVGESTDRIRERLHDVAERRSA